MATVEESQTRDTVIEEVRRIKETLAESQNFDVRRILDEARQNQRQSGRTILPAPSKQNA